MSVKPTAIYSGSHPTTDSPAPTLLRIGNGGAGQSGLIGVLANAFID